MYNMRLATPAVQAERPFVTNITLTYHVHAIYMHPEFNIDFL